MADDAFNSGDDLLKDLERLQETLLKRHLDPHFPPLVHERVHLDPTGDETPLPPETSGDLTNPDAPLNNLSESNVLATDQAESNPDDDALPVLEDIVDHQTLGSSNKPNPFLSSKTLEELIAKRNTAQALSANSVQGRVLQAGLSKTAAAREQAQPELSPELSPELQILIHELPRMIEETVASFLPVIEKAVQLKLLERAEDLRSHLADSDEKA